MKEPGILVRINAVWRVPLIVVVTAVLATVSVFFSFFDGTGRCQHRCARVWAQFIAWVSRVKIEVEGLERLKPDKGYVFAANHLSMFDHWAFLSKLPFQFRFVAKQSLFQIPFLGWHLKRSGNVAVNRRSPRQTLRAYQQVAEQARRGISFVIYPEGMRTWDGVMAPFKKGAFLLARYAEAPIVPVTILDAHRRLKRGSVLLVPGRMRLMIHQPLEYSDYCDWELDRLSAHVREIISRPLSEEVQ